MSKERDEFLRDVAITAAEGGIGYWSVLTKYKWSATNSLDDMLPFPVMRIEPSEDPEDFKACNITKRTIQKGIALIGNPDVTDDELQLAPTYRRQIIGASKLNDACNIDAELADHIVQAGLFGKVIYG